MLGALREPNKFTDMLGALREPWVVMMSIRPPSPLGCNSSRILFSKLTPTCTRHIPQMRLQHTPNALLQTAWPDAFGHDRLLQTVWGNTFERDRLLQTVWSDTFGQDSLLQTAWSDAFGHDRLQQTARSDAFGHDRLQQTANITLSSTPPKVFVL